MPTKSTSIGAMHEQLVIQENVPNPIAVASLTRAGTVATLTTASAHGYATGDFVTVAGAVPTGYNGKVKIAVTGVTIFTYPVSVALATPATGAITVVYVSDASGGRKIGWDTLANIPAELIPIGAMERFQIAAIQSTIQYRFRVRVRVDLTAAMRALWKPSWSEDAPTKTLEISGIQPVDDGRTWMWIEASEVA